MRVEIKDILHYYLGCELDTNITGDYIHPYGFTKITSLTVSNISSVLYALDKKERDQKGGWNDSDHIYCKPILRKFSSMTDDEVQELINYDKIKNEYKQIAYHFDGTSIKIDYTIETDEGTHSQSFQIDRFAMNAYDTAWCFRNGFDLFGLIEKGLAIDHVTL
jgi:hypothetical protein